jgi:hypothetical protein
MKKQFRITLFEGSNSLCDKLAVMAAQANGGRDLTLNKLYIVAEGNRLEYPSMNSNITGVELIGDSLMHIDAKIGNEIKTVMILELVEMLELEEVTGVNGYGGLAE